MPAGTVTDLLCTNRIERKDASKNPERDVFHDASSNDNQDETALVNAVEDKTNNYSLRDYFNASLARKIQDTIGLPSLACFIDVVEAQGGLMNCPITRMDIMAAEDFLAKCGLLKRKNDMD